MAADEDFRSGTGAGDQSGQAAPATAPGPGATASEGKDAEEAARAEAEGKDRAEEPATAAEKEPAAPAEEEPATAAEEEPAAASEAPAAERVVPVAGHAPSGDAPPRQEGSLWRILAYLAVFVAGALVSVGTAFILGLLQGPPPPSAEVDRKIAEVDAHVDSVERRHAAAAAALNALERRLGAAESDARQAAAAARAVEKALAEYPRAETATGAQGSAIEAPDLGPLAARLAALEQKLEEQQAAAPARDAGASDESKATGTADVSRFQAIAIVAGRLVQEVDRGEPYAADLAALENLGAEEAELAPLRASAATGVASQRRLSEEFARLAPSIFATAQSGEAESLVDRLRRVAGNLVHIERADDIERKDVAGLVARIKYALAHDRLADAYAYWKELPDPARTSSESFGSAAKSRLDALSAARAIEAEAVAALSKPKS